MFRSLNWQLKGKDITFKMKQQDTFIQDDYTAGYLDGASAERLRMAELLKEEKNKAIQECITAMLNDQDILFNGSDILGKLESLKSQ